MTETDVVQESYCLTRDDLDGNQYYLTDQNGTIVLEFENSDPMGEVWKYLLM